jgi:hypothetical protein
MTKSDFDAFDDEPAAGPLLLKRALIAVGGTIALLFIAGMIAGFSSVAFKNGIPGFKAFAILGAMLLAGAAVAYGMWRFWPRGLDGPIAPRVRSARTILLASVAIAVPIGTILGIADGGSAALVSDTAVSPGTAIVVIALWAVAGPILTWLWWQRIDEHEAGAYRDGGMIAAHAYMFATPAWWMATRAGWLPPQEPMAVLVTVSLVWMLVWFVRRFF